MARKPSRTPAADTPAADTPVTTVTPVAMPLTTVQPPAADTPAATYGAPWGQAAVPTAAPQGHAATQPRKSTIPVVVRKEWAYAGYGPLPDAYAAAGYSGTFNGVCPPNSKGPRLAVHGKLNGSLAPRKAILTLPVDTTLEAAQAIAADPLHPQMVPLLAPFSKAGLRVLVHAPAGAEGAIEICRMKQRGAPSTKPAAPAQPAPL